MRESVKRWARGLLAHGYCFYQDGGEMVVKCSCGTVIYRGPVDSDHPEFTEHLPKGHWFASKEGSGQ